MKYCAVLSSFLKQEKRESASPGVSNGVFKARYLSLASPRSLSVALKALSLYFLSLNFKCQQKVYWVSLFAFDFGSFVSDSKAKLAGLFVVLCAYRQFNCAVELGGWCHCSGKIYSKTVFHNWRWNISHHRFTMDISQSICLIRFYLCLSFVILHYFPSLRYRLRVWDH